MSGLLQDLRLAVRAWSRIPGVALAAVLTLALGIGVTSAVYSIGNTLLWRALPYPGSDRLTVIYGRTADGGEYEDYAWSELDDFRAGTAEVLSGVAGITPVSVGLAEEGAPAVRVWGEMVSANYFALLRAPMALGRGFAAAEDSAGAPPAVVLSHALWRTRFHGDAAILGRTVRLNRREFTVVGVAAADFATPYYVGFSPTLWVPSGAHAVLHPGRGALDAQGEESVRLVARLADGATLSGAQAVVGLVGRRLAESIGAAQLKQVRAMVDAMERAVKAADARGYHLLNLQFHERLVEMAGNRKLTAIYRKLIKELSLFRRLNLADGWLMPVSASEHRSIVKAIASGDAEAAGRAMFAHVMESKERTVTNHLHRHNTPPGDTAHGRSPGRQRTKLQTA